MARQNVMRLATVALLMLCAASAIVAQVVPSSSIDPLGGSTFTTPFFSVSPTYTITSTFPSAGSVTPTFVAGSAGPSPATGSYSFGFDAPVSSLSGIEPTDVFSSLAANGLPTVYNASYQPDLNGLQVVDAASIPVAPLAVIGSMTLTCLLAALYVL